MKFFLISLSLISTSTFQAALAGTLITDFNDNTLAPLGSATAGAGQTGGLGFLTGDTWSNTGTIDVIAGDLTAPASTNYAIAQDLTPQSVQGTSAIQRQSTRAAANPLAGTVWFSCLLNQPTLEARGGITFNQNNLTTFNPRMLVFGTELRLGLGNVFQATGEGIDILTIGETALILGRITINDEGADTFDVWVNPDVSGDSASLPAPDATLSEDSEAFTNGITRIGVVSYSSDNQGGIIDALRVSDSSNAFEVVAQGEAPTLEDLNLSTSLENPFADVSVLSTDAPVTADILLENTGVTSDLIIDTSTSITGADASSYSILTTLPLTIAPGSTETLQVQLTPSEESSISTASLELSSNDSSDPITTIPLEARTVAASGNQLINSNFEDDPTIPVNWGLEGDVTIIGGIAPDSTSSASLAAGSDLNQEIVSGEADWFLTAFFQAPDTPERAINILIESTGTPATQTANINLRFQGTSEGAEQTWNLFDTATDNDAWGPALALPAVQPGATYFIRITGRNWGGDTPNPRYDIELSEPNSTSIAGIITDLGRFQASIPSAPPNEISFSTLFGNAPGFIVDDVQFVNGIPITEVPVITSIFYNQPSQAATLTFEALIGFTYTISASNDLMSWDDIGTLTATSTLESFTEFSVTFPRRFYQVSINQ